jgi:hypothetical protein
VDPFFTSNDQDITRLEGLYVKERLPPASVKGINLNTVGVIGDCVRGPVNTVVEIGSEARLLEVFGGRDHGSGGSVVGKVWQALVNRKFGSIRVIRVAAAAAVKASFTLETAAGGGGTAVLRVDASSVGTWGNNVGVKVAAATNGDANYFDLYVRYLGNVKVYKNLTIASTADNTLTILGDDYGNLVTLTKLAAGRPVNNVASTDGADTDGYVLLGQTVASYTSVAGTDGSLAASDYTATGGPMEKINAYKGVGICFVAEPASAHYAAIKAKVLIEAAKVSDRMWIIGANDETVTRTAAVTDVATYRSDRVIYAFNHLYTLDPDTATNMLVRPEGLMASILSQTDVDIHPGEEDAKAYAAGVRSLYNESLTRDDYIACRDAGISALEKDEGFAFVSGVTTSLTPGKEQITRRRMADFIQLGVAGFLKYSVKKKNLQTRRNANKAAVQAWLRDLAAAERVVDRNDDGVGLFVVDTESLNTTAQRAAGVEKMLVRVKLVSHMLHLVLETELGTGTVIEVS